MPSVVATPSLSQSTSVPPFIVVFNYAPWKKLHNHKKENTNLSLQAYIGD
jgi:hypothetical protein